jgi:type I restriction-modification system DNA methylase subunit
MAVMFDTGSVFHGSKNADSSCKCDICKIITKEEAARNDYNLSPSRYVAQNGEDNTLPLEDAVVQL